MKKPPLLESLLILGILAGVAGHVLLTNDPEERGWVFAPEMSTSGAYEAQDPNPHMPDGKVLQLPQPGTVARGFLPPMHEGKLLDGTTAWDKLAADQQAAWNALAAPVPAKEDAGARARRLQRGSDVYARFCTPCHGAGGKGDGPVTKRGVPPPKSFLGEELRALSDGRMYRSITYGHGNMASYASQVEREDRWKAILYIRSLQGTP